MQHTRHNVKRGTPKKLRRYIIEDWQCTRNEVSQDLKQYQALRDKLAIADETVIKNRRIIISTALKHEALGKINITCLGIMKMRMLARKSIYWVIMNSDIHNSIKNVPFVLNFSNHNP